MPNAHTVIAVNYHRIGPVDADNPLHRLHTVDTDVFRAQLDHMQQHGAIVSPDDVRGCHGLADINFVVSFDDVPAAAMTGIQMMLDRRLPVTVSVCTHLASAGWGTRDKVYCLGPVADPDTLTAAVRAAFPDVAGDGERRVVLPRHQTRRPRPRPGHRQTDRPALRHVEPLARASTVPAIPVVGQQSGDLAGRSAGDHRQPHRQPPQPRRPTPRRGWQRDRAAHHALTEQLRRPPAGTSPSRSGDFTQRLALDCLDLVHRAGLSRHPVGRRRRPSLVAAPYQAQLLQLTRLHAAHHPRRVRRARPTGWSRHAVASAVWQLPPRPHRDSGHDRRHPATHSESPATRCWPGKARTTPPAPTSTATSSPPTPPRAPGRTTTRWSATAASRRPRTTSTPPSASARSPSPGSTSPAGASSPTHTTPRPAGSSSG